jgi:hypothetical protein
MKNTKVNPFPTVSKELTSVTEPKFDTDEGTKLEEQVAREGNCVCDWCIGWRKRHGIPEKNERGMIAKIGKYTFSTELVVDKSDPKQLVELYVNDPATFKKLCDLFGSNRIEVVIRMRGIG